MSGLALGWGRALRKPRKRVQSGFNAEINVTPLVDVVLVLLVIFMLTVPLLNQEGEVDLPLTQHHDARQDDHRDVVVVMTQSADLFVGAERVALEQLGGAVAQQQRRQPGAGLVVRADGRLSYGQVRRVIEALYRSGNNRIQLATESLASGQTPPGTEP